MPSAVSLLLVVLAVVGIGFVLFWWNALRKTAGGAMPSPYQLLVGAITDFFDTLGIGSFATTTSLWRARRPVPDEHIPGTPHLGHTPPPILQAFLYIDCVQVETWTLVLMIAGAVAGALLGAPIVAGWPRQQIQRGLGIALLALCAVLVYRLWFGDPKGGDALELGGAML